MAIYQSPTLTTLMTSIKVWLNKHASYLTGDDPGLSGFTWFIPVGAEIMDPEWMGLVFTDNELRGTYYEAHISGKPYSETMQYNQQMNELMLLERSFRGRHLTPVRALYHAAGRQAGQAEGVARVLQ